MKNKVLFLMVIFILLGNGSLIFAADPSQSQFVIATATNTDTTGHGNVKFKVGLGSDGKFYCLIWSKYAYSQSSGPRGYRKWYKPIRSIKGTILLGAVAGIKMESNADK